MKLKLLFNADVDFIKNMMGNVAAALPGDDVVGNRLKLLLVDGGLIVENATKQDEDSLMDAGYKFEKC